MYLDVHAHQKSNDTQILVGVHTKAVHPWELTLPFDRQRFDEKWEEVKASAKDIVAVGECGLDRVHEGIASIDDQVYVLLKHFELARELKLPIIIHSVRTHSDLLGILKKIKFQQPVMLHAFGGNEKEMHDYLKYDVTFTYGKRIFKNDSMLKITPLKNLMFETGDQTEFSIADIYQQGAKSLGMEVEKLEEQLYANFKRVFNQLDDVSASDFIKNLNIRKSQG
nr:TatD family hydrolase [Bacteriovorax sp. HI3]